MVNKTNILLVITTGNDATYPANCLHFWDDTKFRFVGRINQFDSDPITISHANNIITVGTQNTICCLKMDSLKIFSTVHTTQATPNSLDSALLGGLHSLSEGKRFAFFTCLY